MSSGLGPLSQASMVTKPFSGHFPETTAPLEIVHVDLYGISSKDLPKSADGCKRHNRYAAVFVDDHSRLPRVYPLKQRSDFPKALRWFLEEVGAKSLFGAVLMIHNGLRFLMHTDGGSEIVSKEVAAILREHGFSGTVTSARDSPSDNGVAERMIRTLSTGMRARMIWSELPPQHWFWAFWDAANALAYSASQRVLDAAGNVKYVSRYELFHKRKPDMRHLVTFGAHCMVRATGIDLQNRGKTKNRTRSGRVLGWAGHGVVVDTTVRYILGYAVLLDEGHVIFSRNVAIDERPMVDAVARGEYYGPIDAGSGHPEPLSPPGDGESPTPGEGGRDDGNDEPPDLEHFSDAESEDDLEPARTARRQPGLPLRPDREVRASTRAARGPQISTLDVDPNDAKREQRKALEQVYGGLAENVSVQAAIIPKLNGKPVEIPQSYRAAMVSPQAEHWQEAIDEHVCGLDKLRAYKFEAVPKATKAIPSKHVFDVKTDATGEVTRWKDRVVVQGFRQNDVAEVFAPAIRAEQVRFMIATAARHYGKRLSAMVGRNPTVEQITLAQHLLTADVKDAYPSSPLPEDEQIYFTVPDGWDTKGIKVPPGYKAVCRAINAIPGMRQGGRVWYTHQRRTLLDLGFQPCAVAACIYVKKTAHGLLVIGHFVDDLILLNLTDDPDAFRDVRAALCERHEIKFAERLEKFVGAQFEVTEDGIYMHLSKYIGDLLTKHDTGGGRAASTPEPSEEPANRDERLLQRADVKTYQEITGSLMFCMTTCRPDIAHATNVLARRMAVPRVCDMERAHRVLRYLRATQRKGLLFRFSEDERFPGLVAMADSDWANDSIERRSTTGWIVLYNGTPVSWYSGLQSVIALSTCEAEYVALSECCRELVYLRQLADFLKDPCASTATVIYEDNQGTIDLVGNPVHHKRSKHIDVKYHYIRAQQQDGKVVVKKVHTDYNIADMFTKSTSVQTFNRHVSVIMHDAPRADVEGGS